MKGAISGTPPAGVWSLFKTLAAVIGPTFLGLVPDDHALIFICNMMYNAGFYFMPILAGFTAAQKLGANPYLGAMAGNGLAALFEWLGNSPLGWFAVALVAATHPMLVLTGMHIGIMGIAIANFGAVGFDKMFLMAATVQNFTASGVGLAVWLKMKDKATKNLCLG